jgi:outer membrane protein assembly factor BamB
MNIKQNKIAALVIAILLTSTIATSLAFMPTASAHTPAWLIPTFPHIYAATNPIGVGQKAFVYLWVCPTYDATTITNDYRFHNWTLTIVAPSGAVTEQKFATIQDTTSNIGTTFVPTETGVYNLTLTVPPQAVNDYSHSLTSQYINDTYMGGTASTTLTVQQDQVLDISYPPLPTEYWTRPIFGTNSVWYQITSNWLGTGMPGYGGATAPNLLAFSGGSVGSLTGHIMWTKTHSEPGGVAGGTNFEILGNTWFEGTAYSQHYSNPIIVAGMLVYREPLESTGNSGDTVCVDLYTGQEIWRNPTAPSFSFAYVQDMQNPDFHGVRPAYLCTSNFAQVWDAATGKSVFNCSAVPSGTNVIGPNGEVLKYIFFNNGTTSVPDYYLCLWNSSRFWQTGSMSQRSLQSQTFNVAMNYSETTYINGSRQTNLTPYTNTYTQVNASRSLFYEWLDSTTQNVSISWRNNQAGSPTILTVFRNDIMLCRNGSYPSNNGPTGNAAYNYFAVNLNSSNGAIGKILWMNTVQPAMDPVYGNITTISLASGVNYAGADKSGYFCESYRPTQQLAFFNLRTGAFIKLSDSQPAMDFYGSTSAGTLNNVNAFGRTYASGYAGVVYCYDMSTGNVLWTYGNGGAGNTTYSGNEVPGHYPTFVKAIGGHDLSDGVVYTIVTEHTFETPIYKGALQRAINASDGTEIYTVQAATGEFSANSFAIADGYTNFFNSYDSRIYTLGRGPSQTTVAVGPKGSTIGGSVVIEGTVNDVSVGLQTTEIQGRFPTGVPVAADSSMCDWMAYVYQQQPKPTNFTGVNVHLIVLDGNGNYQDLGTTTTDTKGQYGISWMPNVPGDFKVYAYFDGTKGYWPSSAETLFTVDPAAPTASPAPTLAPSTVEQYFLPAIAGLFALIIIVAAVLALMMRKHP